MGTQTKRAKTALVLAGGGLTGAVYEIGALRAIDDLLIDRTVNDFDIFVGTSAGAFVATFLAHGISPEEMLQSIDGSEPDVEPLQAQHLFNINLREAASWGVGLPGKLLGAWTQFLFNIDDMTLFDLFWSLSNTLPAGIYDVQGLERYVRKTLQKLGKSNQFADLEKELYLIATELDSGDRTIFGRGGIEDAPISVAMAASAAVPLLYKPVRIGGHEYVDGGLRGNASIDVAIEQGADLVVCINPMVPIDNTYRRSQLASRRRRYLSQKGIQSVAGQTLRISTHASLQYHLKQLRRSNPQVDIILIEPRPEYYKLFSYNMMRYSARLDVARQGFESVTIDLSQDYPYYKQVLTRHAIPISRRLVIEEITEIRDSGYDERIIRQILEAQKGPCGRHRFDTPACRLAQVLSELEMALDSQLSG